MPMNRLQMTFFCRFQIARVIFILFILFVANSRPKCIANSFVFGCELAVCDILQHLTKFAVGHRRMIYTGFRNNLLH